MKLGIMQPYFFPYLGYFGLIKHSDKFILFDTPQFIRHGWIERNRILKQDGIGWMYIRVPLLKHSRETAIKDILIRKDEPWQYKILEQIKHYKKGAKYYKEVRDLLADVILFECNTITEVNQRAIKAVCDYLNLNVPILTFSEMNLNIEKPRDADEWALNISKALKAKEYINPPGGESFLDKRKYMNAGIDLKFMQLRLGSYEQFNNNFEAGLSIIDVMMFNSSENINRMLNDFELR